MQYRSSVFLQSRFPSPESQARFILRPEVPSSGLILANLEPLSFPESKAPGIKTYNLLKIIRERDERSMQDQVAISIDLGNGGNVDDVKGYLGVG